MTEPLVSIITPAYNVGGYLAPAIESVRAQSFTHWEHLIIDDGSTDDTLGVARRLAEPDDRIRVMTIAHAGSSAARNAGIVAARGSYIAFLDGDDTWDPTFLQRMLDHLQAAPPAVRAVFCRSWQFTGGSSRIGVHTFEPGAYDLARMLSRWNPTGNGSSLLIRGEALAEAGPFREDLPSAVDLDLWLRILAVSAEYRFLGVPEVLTNYRRRVGSISADVTARFDALITILNDHGHRLSDADRQGYAYPILMGLRCGRPREAAALYRAARPWTHPSWFADRAWRLISIRLLLMALGRPVETFAAGARRRMRGWLRRPVPGTRASSS